ncbi:MAG: hypothetical protein NTW21_34515 [Verrucomicrobia bacterium]|nr:hypothetical protein [Verrucomicrobiota bacterium]
MPQAEKRRAVLERFGSAADDILAICAETIRLRKKIDTLRAQRLKVQTLMGTTERAVFFHSQISDEKWGDYVTTLKKLAAELRDHLAAVPLSA